MTISRKGRKRLGVIRAVSGIILFGAFILAFGTAGASDMNTITYKQICIYSDISIILMLVSGYVFNWANFIITNCKVRRRRGN